MPLTTHHLRLLHFNLSVSTDNSTLEKIILQEIQTYYNQPQSFLRQMGEGGVPDTKLHFSISCSENDQTMLLPTSTRRSTPILKYLPTENLLHISLPYGCGTVIINYSHNTVTAVVTPAIFRYRNILFNWIITIPLAELVRQWGYFFLHAAALVKDSRAIVFAGKSTSGKSTLALSLLSQDWRLVTDDEGFLRYDDGYYLHGCSTWAKLTPATWRLFATYLGPEADFHGKRRCDLSQYFSQKPLPQAPVSALCLINPGKTNRLTRLKPIAAVTKLLDLAFLPGYPPYARTTFHFFCQLANTIPVYRLAFALQPDALNQFLEKELLTQLE